MDEYSELTAHYIQQRFKLPKIAAKKIQQANRFINDPNSVIKVILDKRHHPEESDEKQKQNPHSSRVNHHLKRTVTLEQQKDTTPERHLISLKMKKFKPVNGSFSQLYGEQLSIDVNRGKKLQKNGGNQLQSPRNDLNKRNSYRMLKKYKKYGMSTETIDSSMINYRQLPYLSKLKEIRDTSEMLRQNSRHLLKKADSACQFNEINYQKLREQSTRILTGEQKYNFNEQLTTEHLGNSASMHKRWKSRK